MSYLFISCHNKVSKVAPVLHYVVNSHVHLYKQYKLQYGKQADWI